MKSESDANSGVLECVPGEGLEHIFIFLHFHKIRICYVFRCHRRTLVFRSNKKLKIYNVCAGKSKRCCRILMRFFYIKAVREAQIAASACGFSRFAQYIENISSRAPRASSTSRSNRCGASTNRSYVTCFKRNQMREPKSRFCIISLTKQHLSKHVLSAEQAVSLLFYRESQRYSAWIHAIRDAA